MAQLRQFEDSLMRAWVEVDINKLGQNIQIIRQQIGQSLGLIAVVKTDAYGHGITRITEALDRQPVDMFAVISVEEAFAVRQVSHKPVLVMSYVDSKDLIDAIEADFTVSLYDKELVPFFERVAARLGRQLSVHVKVETGLNRLGMSVNEAADFLISQRLFPHLKVEGIFSHLASAADPVQNAEQFDQLQELLVTIQGKCPVVPIHLVSSYALSNFKQGYFDAVRPGLAMYGTEAVLPGLKPIMSCKSVVMQVKNVAKGEGVSYGHLYVAPKDIKIAVVAIGYGEGLSQALTGHLTVLIGGQERPVLGQICMNLIIADVTSQAVKRGDEVVIIGSQPDENGRVATISVADLAKRSRIRHHEIVTRLGRALPRFYEPK